jgi:hypothetical protein
MKNIKKYKQQSRQDNYSHHPLRYDDVHIVHRQCDFLHLPSYHFHYVGISVVSYNKTTLLYYIADREKEERRGREAGLDRMN